LTSSKKTDKSDEIHDSMFKSENVGKSKPRKKQTKKKQTEVSTEESPVGQYVHPNEKRKNNPPVGMVDTNNDPDQPSKRYSYDPRLDPQLQWSGKTENSEFDVDTLSLHVHERIDPLTIIEKTMKEKTEFQQSLFHYFELPENNPSLTNAIEFYKHEQNWSNRLIAGDSLLIMNSLLQKENMTGKVQMIYIDPPYGIKYGSNFQPYFNKTEVKDGKDEDLTNEPETIKAFRDTWELGIHSYLTYLRNRIYLSRNLLTESGSIFVQISDENIHYVKAIMDEIFGRNNFCKIITFQKTSGQDTKILATTVDYIIWYAKDISKLKYRQLFDFRKVGATSLDRYDMLLLSDKSSRRLTSQEMKTGEIPSGSRRFRWLELYSEGGTKSESDFEFEGEVFTPRTGTHWKTTISGLENLVKSGRIKKIGNLLRYLRFADDFPLVPLTDRWESVQLGVRRKYVVETSKKVIERCILMTTDPGDLIFDPTCGSGTSAYAAEKWGRRWITCDSSRIAISLTKQRLMTSTFSFYELAKMNEGLSSGFQYETVPHITLKSIARNEEPSVEKLYNKPIINKSKIRISGPFTVEAVPSPTVKSIDSLYENNSNSNQTTGLSQQEWRDELLRVGIRGKNGQKIEFSMVQSHPTTKWIHADAQTKEEKPKRVMISFGPEHAPLEQRQIENAIEESQSLVPKPNMIIFAAMQFDPEASKDIDQLNWPGVTILKAEMNKDLLINDLKKKQSSNESFWLMGSPDIECMKEQDGKYVVTVNGFDYYNTKTNEVESGNSSKIAMWELDTDYDGRSVYPQQVFFPMDGKSEGWSKLAKTLRGNIDEDLITKYRGTESIPFDMGVNKRIAVKIVDDRGVESLKIIDLE
jgi:adenine-specific DNA-methyltransferase